MLDSGSGEARIEKISSSGRVPVLSWKSLRILAVLPPLVLAICIALFAVDTPWFDEWDLSPTLIAARTGTLTFGDLWQLYNSHRILIPRLFFIALTGSGFWHPIRSMWASVAVAAATFFLLSKLIRDMVADERRRNALLFFASVVVFSLNQHENWYWGFQLSWYLCNFFVIAAIAAALKWRQSAAGISAAAFLVVCACLCAAHEFAGWVAILPCLKNRRQILLWSFLALIAAAVYVGGQHLVPARENSLWSLLSIVPFAMVVLGSPLARVTALAMPAGTVLSGIVAVLTVRARRAGVEFRAPLAIALYSFAFALLCGFGRGMLGFNQGIASRYTTPAGLLLIGIAMLAAAVVRDERCAGIITALGAVMFAAALFIIPYLSGRAAGRRIGQLAVLTFPLSRGVVLPFDTSKDDPSHYIEELCATNLLDCPRPRPVGRIRFERPSYSIRYSPLRHEPLAESASGRSPAGLGVVFAIDRDGRAVAAAVAEDGRWQMEIRPPASVRFLWFDAGRRAYYRLDETPPSPVR